MDNPHNEYWQALDLLSWKRRVPTEKEAQPLDDWHTLEQTVAKCIACSLHETRTQTVFGVGNRSADLMIIGEAPGFNEDQQGEPFVGRAGQLLTAMLKSIGFTRDQVYIANILKCRPPNNRDPDAREVEKCTPFLHQQIALVKPRLLLAVGRIASHYLLKTKSSLEALRQKKYFYGEAETPLIVTYHPAYLLRNPVDKKKAFVDLQFTQRTLKNLLGEINHGSVPPYPESSLSTIAS